MGMATTALTIALFQSTLCRQFHFFSDGNLTLLIVKRRYDGFSAASTRHTRTIAFHLNVILSVSLQHGQIIVLYKVE